MRATAIIINLNDRIYSFLCIQTILIAFRFYHIRIVLQRTIPPTTTNNDSFYCRFNLKCSRMDNRCKTNENAKNEIAFHLRLLSASVECIYFFYFFFCFVILACASGGVWRAAIQNWTERNGTERRNIPAIFFVSSKYEVHICRFFFLFSERHSRWSKIPTKRHLLHRFWANDRDREHGIAL